MFSSIEGKIPYFHIFDFVHNFIRFCCVISNNLEKFHVLYIRSTLLLSKTLTIPGLKFPSLHIYFSLRHQIAFLTGSGRYKYYLPSKLPNQLEIYSNYMTKATDDVENLKYLFAINIFFNGTIW